ncbi:MAG: GTPase HflX [Cytophagales bacterium]|nr:GTPase HflX [Cytophagales bacterium]
MKNSPSVSVILVGIWYKGKGADKTAEYLAELGSIARTRGWEVVKTFSQSLARPHPGTLIGRGKMEEIKSYIQEQNIDRPIQGIVFDEELSPVHLRNLEAFFQLPVSDRSLMILEVFSQHARTAQAKVQVNLAKYEYLLPRLTRLWTHLERQRGGQNTRGGAGEKEIETDRRNIRNRIVQLKRKWKKIKRHAQVQRKGRENWIRIACVGYTNVGKSSLMNLLSKSRVPVEDKLFATLDTTVRRITWPEARFLLSDTVGFIRKLPQNLLSSFRSTLDEVREADLLLHVLDISNKSFLEQAEVVEKTLMEVCPQKIPTMWICNKIDKLSEKEREEAENELFVLRKRHGGEALFTISAMQKTGLDNIKQSLSKWVAQKKGNHQSSPMHTQHGPVVQWIE